MNNTTPDRMILRGAYLRINMPDMFADDEFLAYLNDPANNLATWHRKGDSPHEFSDCFVQYDDGDGSHSNMPEKWWALICEICEAEGFTAGLLHLTNLEV